MYIFNALSEDYLRIFSEKRQCREHDIVEYLPG